ncbi:MAG: aldo/keto reductase [Acutalibacteraceae bacterium]
MNFGLKKLGFGFMRLPTLSSGEVDIEQVKEMVDLYINNGFNYFDTAFGYLDGKSEGILRQTVVERYPRNSFLIADKMPMWEVSSKDDLERIFNTQLERTGAKYFDFYLLHSLYEGTFKKAEKFGAWEFLKQKKEQGKIKHIGFSFHDDAKCLDKILQTYNDCQFVQLQINYADWDSETIQSRLCLDTAKKYDMPVIVMEPVKGGSLSALPENARKLFKKSEPNWSIPSWAMRFATTQDGVALVLSGMSNVSQVKDSIEIFNDIRPLTNEQMGVIGEVVDILNSTPTIKCTNCQYCVSDCPQQIPIPEIIGLLNRYNTYLNISGPKRSYGWSVEGTGKASDCIACGLCEEHCPQHLEIIKALKESAKVFED